MYYLEKKNGKENISFKEINKGIAKEIIIKNHYSHSWYHNFGFVNVGVFKEDRLLGVASFGKIKVPKSYKNICDEIKQDEIMELNRLWVDDCLGRNTETMLLGVAFRIFREKYKKIRIIQSYADGRLGCGTIYKAANFKYYGFHETEFYKNEKTGKIIPEITLHTSSRPGVITRNLDLIENEYTKFKVKTYRYLYILDKKLRNKIKIRELPYPKYEKGITNMVYVKNKIKNEKNIQNTINYLMEGGIDLFKFSYKDRLVAYTRQDFNNNISVFDCIKREFRQQKLL
jgi:hypothetical protein